MYNQSDCYYIDTPGHCIGHICGLVRTKPEPESNFILLGGDICHFPGDFRPSIEVPLPDPIPNFILDQDPLFPKPCPCSIFTNRHPRQSSNCDDPRKSPFYHLSTDSTSAYVDPEVASRSVQSLLAFDACPRVLICLAHDETVLKTLPTLNNNPDDDLNNWEQRGYKDKVRWGWLNDLPRNGRSGREPVVEGFWRENCRWPQAKEELKRMGERGLAKPFSLAPAMTN